MTLRSTFIELLGHIQAERDPSFLETLLRCFSGYLSVEEVVRLRSHLLMRDFDSALNVIGNLEVRNDTDARLLDRLELMLFFLEQKQDRSVTAPAAVVVRSDESSETNAEDHYLLQESEKLKPLLDFDQDEASFLEGRLKQEGHSSNQSASTSMASSPDDGGEEKVGEIPGEVEFSAEILDAEVAAEIEEHSRLEEPDSVSKDELPLVAVVMPGDDVYSPDDFDDAKFADGSASGAGFADLEDEYAVYAYDPDELYAVAEERSIPAANRLTREERAKQIASDLIARTSWDKSALTLLTNIFVVSGWSAARVAIEREINEGLTKEELVLAAHLKVVWSENDYYWISFSRGGSALLSNSVLSWPTALKVVRSFNSLPQVEELEALVEQVYEFWMEADHLRRAFRSFARFLWFRFADLEGCLPASEPFSFGSPIDLDSSEFSDISSTDIFEVQRAAQLKALGVPDGVYSRFWMTTYTVQCERMRAIQEALEDKQQRELEAAYAALASSNRQAVDELDYDDQLEMEVDDVD